MHQNLANINGTIIKSRCGKNILKSPTYLPTYLPKQRIIFSGNDWAKE